MPRLPALLVVFIVTLPLATAEDSESKPLTLDLILGENRLDFSGEYATGLRWIDDRHYMRRVDNLPTRIDAETSERTSPIDREALESALREHPDFDDDDAETMSRRPGTFSDDRATILMRHDDRAYLYRIDAGTVRRITEAQSDRRELLLSPSTKYLSFVEDNDLYTVDVADREVRRLTHDGSEHLLNGILDWVYQEEVYGRGRWRGYWWRDDDAWIAYLQIDEHAVPEFTILDQVTSHPAVETLHYPKPGDPNPTVRLGCVRPDGRDPETVWVDLSKYKDSDEILIVNVDWSPAGKLVYQVQNREQTWLDLNEADPRTGRARTLFRETSRAWVNALGAPHWLEDGTFLWQSERDGWRHLYHYRADGTLIRRLTVGEWEVRALHGIDETTGWVYFSGTKETPIEVHAYRVALDGGPIVRLTPPGFSHRVRFSTGFTYFLDTFSNAYTPARVALHRADGTVVRTISDNPVTTHQEYGFVRPQFLRVPARDGRLLNAMVIKPPNFNSAQRYPVWSYVYGGPQSPAVHNRYNSRFDYLLYQYLAQQGFIVWILDPRSASGEGVVSAWEAYEQLGVTELRDLEDGIRWLVEQGWADPERIGLWGFSYGGYLTSYALTHSTVFKVGIAGGAVTDWHNYDSIYTERYMRKPANNAGGYRISSAVEAAADLHGKLLLIHGLIDENVHFQNIVEFMNALQAANKPFDLMVYPGNRHGIRRNAEHYHRLRLRYIMENLLEKPPSPKPRPMEESAGASHGR